jgi:hypothetical protein
MGTFSLEKAPIPLLANRSLQTAPSYSYYDRFTSVPIRGLTLYETRIRFVQTLSGLLSSGPLLARLIRPSESEDSSDWFGMQQVVVLSDGSLLYPPGKPAFQRMVLSDLALKRWSNFNILRRG